LFELQLAGYRLILAHPERYLFWYKDFEKFQELKGRGILFQLNTMSLGGYFGDEVYGLAKRLVEEEMIELLGTDTHGARHIEAIRNTLHSPVLDKLIKSGNIINRRF
jgi:tyrosine-protein phosphatase YwqE